MNKVCWGVLSTAKIGVEKVIPAMQKARSCTVTALASRDPARAKTVARKLRLPKAYGSYEALLADPEIDAVYIHLPNHLHVDWSIKSLEAGKHVLCEKPIGLDVADARKLLDAARRYPHLKVMEAFMYRHHPQWIKARQLVAEGGIGPLRSIHSFFSMLNWKPSSVNLVSRHSASASILLSILPIVFSIRARTSGSEPVIVQRRPGQHSQQA